MTVARRLKEFHADDRGAITPLMLVLFITLVIITGLAIDMVRHEAERADLQDALDRGVLAAAQFGQDVDPQVVVEEYVRSRNFGDSEVDLTVQFTAQTPYERRIDADALYDMDTVFMAMTGVDTLGVAAGASALQGRTAIEISLVLDISGTMRYSSRIENLRIAANEFITEMLADGADSYTTISIVPYAGQVNPGPEMFSALGGVRWHAFSSCPEFTASDFGLDRSPALPRRGCPTTARTIRCRIFTNGQSTGRTWTGAGARPIRCTASSIR
ncbi:MAG: Tad domain-containing protein [Pseudomonadota bacterium]